ncbi:MAG: bifunctional 4-hydroxy-2-oxoglutarate aldolase/2-dehydro-3-deoxy-phosphogluconate aldolase [Clostridia bacterium]|nr:bifunctional 4-hydroxy-2-oxoglutarate aldolase/2-dehydro-3-deoxy-phosphogluconate aldolase [Clostridia bacterium]
MDRNEIISRITEEQLITIVRGVKNVLLIPMAEAMYAGGVRLLEITYSADGSTPDEVTADGIRALKAHFGDRMGIGAGTVLTERQVELTAEAGGEFIISPDTNSDVIRKTVKMGLVSIPGALTPTEAQTAHRAGADFVKLFPITSLGVPYVKAIRAPLSHIRFLAVGGVDEHNMKDYLAAGIAGFGIGSNIVNKKMIESGDFDGVTALARDFIQALAEARK